jgi:hypothetical protein
VPAPKSAQRPPGVIPARISAIISEESTAFSKLTPCQGKRIRIFSWFNKGHRVSQGRNALRPTEKIIHTEPL